MTVATGLDLLAEPHSLAIGPTPEIYAYVKSTIHRNLYRIPLP